MDPAHLADKLAAALDQVVPEPFVVSEYQGMVLIQGGRSKAASEVAEIVDQPGDMLKLASNAALSALSLVQDHIAQDLATPWPSTGNKLPLPQVSVTPGEIHLWYETLEGQRVLEVPTISW